MSPASFPVVVIPTYNEKENIEQIIPLILEQDSRFKILVVDDSSPDGTADTVRQLQKQYPNKIDLIVRTQRGRGTAVICGFEAALNMGATSMLEMDADFSHNPIDLKRFLAEIEHADVVVGSRFLPGGAIENRSWIRNLLSAVLNGLIRMILGLKVSDASGGFRLFKREVIAKLDFKRFVSKNYSFCPEVLYQVSRAGFGIKEIPIRFVNRKAGKSKANFGIALDYFLSIIRIRFSSAAR